MRAAVAPGQKVLRVALVRGGRIVEERIVCARGDVTIGPSEHCTFSLHADEGTRSVVRLLEARGTDYVLRLGDRMSARLSTPDGIVELSRDNGPVLVSAEVRGKVELRGAVLLFQFVAAPPKQAKAALPPSLVRGTTIDWVTTIVAAFSFLIHFGAVGSVYSDWLDEIVDDDIRVGALLDRVAPMPPPAPDPELPPSDIAKDAEPAKPSTNPSPTASPARHRDTSNKGQSSEAAVSRALEQMQLETLGVFAQGSATEGVLRHGEVPTNSLDIAAARDSGVGIGEFSPGSSRGTPIRVGSGPGLESLGALGLERGGEAGKAKAFSGPPGRIDLGKEHNVGGRITNAAAVIAAMRAGFKRCYDRALAQNADAQGRIALSIHVGPGGEVQSVSAETSGNLPSSVGACVSARARAAQFELPEGGLAVVQVPVTFVKQ
jgi:hypothetical protein